MSTADILRNLVIANRILAHEGVVDAYGHISVRHPERSDRFFLSASHTISTATRWTCGTACNIPSAQFTAASTAAVLT